MSSAKTSTVELSSFAQFYRALQTKDPKASLVSFLQNVFLSKIEIEPVTGEPNIMALSHIATTTKLEFQDKFTQLLSYSDVALKSVINQPRYKVIREHGFVPIYKAQQLDNRSVQWLSRQPGNNIRQKLSANPNVLALTRRNCLDTQENRFVHNVIKYLDYLLEVKQESLGLTDDQEWLTQELDLWCSKEEVKEIKAWEAMPPNNVLLEDKNYKKIWHVGNKLNRLDEEISYIFNNLTTSFSHRLWFELITHLQGVSGVHFIEYMLLPNIADLTFERAYTSLKNDSKNLEAKGIYSPGQSNYDEISANYDYQKSEIVLEYHSGIKKRFTVSISTQGVVVNDKDKQLFSYTLTDNIREMAKNISHTWLGTSTHQTPRRLQTLKSDSFATINLSSSQPYIRCEPRPNKDTPDKKVVNKASILPLRLIGQKFKESGDILDLSLSTAIDLDEDAEILNYHSIFEDENAFFVADQIAKGLISPKVNYLLSDHISDFESKIVRREFNRVFYRATPLPRSIAATFALHKTNETIQKGRLFVVLEHALDGLYATPILGHKNEKESYWERHPSFKVNKKGSNTLVEEALEKEYPSDIINFLSSTFGYSELISKNTKPAIKYKDNWFVLNENQRKNISGKVISVNKASLSDLLKKNGINNYHSLNIISLSPSIKNEDFHPKQYHEKLDVTLGSQALHDLISIDKNRVYWRDHLPKLYTRLPKAGKEVELIFVDGKTTIEPKRGSRVSLPIKSTFTIPAGKEKITLPIFQGQGEESKRFMLTLEHSVFPLKKAIHCKLDLGYTYGDEEPYQLIFRPIDDGAPFNQVIAKWSSWNMTLEQKRVCPLYPAVQPVAELSKLTSKGKKATDILEWSERVFSDIDNYHSLLMNGKYSPQTYIKLSDHNYSYSYDFQKIKLEFGEVAIHRKDFDVDLFDKHPDEVLGRLFKNKHGGYKLEKISSTGSLRGRWRFPMLTLFDQERSIDEFPIELQRKARVALEKAVGLLEHNIPNWFKPELRQFICYFHSGVPENIANQLVEDSNSKSGLRKSMLNISYALGDCSTKWQKVLLNNVLNPTDDQGGTRAVTLEILGTAVWRSKSLIYQLTNNQVDSLVERLSDFISHEEGKIKLNDPDYKWNSLLRRLELAFALLRLRESTNLKVAESMEVGMDNSDKLLAAIQLINKKLGAMLFNRMNKDNRVKCRLYMDTINKPESYNKTPDILYSLNMYLSGDDGANSITINEISSE